MNFKEFLKTNNLKQVELASYLGISEAAVSNLVKQKSNPSEDTLIKIFNNKDWDVSMLTDKNPEVQAQFIGHGNQNINVGHHNSTGNNDSAEKFSVKIATLSEQLKLRDQKIQELEEQLREEKERSSQYWEMIQKLMK